nr:RNA-directed DNA polymerase, eukaryota, reverse transcriptase zinc-binding domain protein [Tanacetum cinerariifolium]
RWESDSGDEHSEGELNGDILRSNEDFEGDNKKDVIPDTVFEDNLPKSHDEEASVGQNKVQSEDPFNIYTLLNKKKENNEKISVTHDSLKYPPSFTPKEDVETNVKQSKNRNGSVREIGEELIETKMESIDLVDIKRCWGNFVFDYVHSDSVRNSGGILCVWDTNSLKKLNDTVSNYFVMIRGEVIVMGDFNEVCNKYERFGLVFNVQGANAFNSFISSAGLEEVPLGAELENLDSIIDKGEGNDDIINKRIAVVKSIQELDKLQSMEAAQKAKIKWTIEGDENSKYYHGILNQKRHQLSIRGVLANETWIDNHVLVKNEFLSHFKNRFERPKEARLNLNMEFPCKLTCVQQSDLEIDVSNDEIKRAV